MSYIRNVLLLAFIGLALAACSQTPYADAPKADTPKTPEATFATTAASPYTYYQWTKGGPLNTPLIDMNEGFCWLSGVQGGQGWLTRAVVAKSPSSGRWNLAVEYEEWASATCIKWSALKIANDAIQPARMISDSFKSAGDWRGGRTYTWWGDAATYISGISGNLSHRGEVDITQSRSGLAESSWISSSNWDIQDWDYRAFGYAHSMFFGKPQTNDVPQFWGPKGQGVPFAQAGEYWVDTSTKPSVDMAPTAKAFCYLSNVSGSFDDREDWVWLYRTHNSAGEEVWRLNVHNAKASVLDADVTAAATCYMLTQY